ncbi:MAG: FAD-dependent oxidoreductase [Rubrobacter sp.]|nr:FAD-dependent oxidoreductase [Rubrobacter sp.]
MRCVIVGAGVSGLLAARALEGAGWETVVLDKGRGVGGRMATRRMADGVFDHGAQFFTARSEEFKKLVEEWTDAGAATEWSRGFADADAEREPDGHPRYRGSSGMTSIPKHLADGLDVRTGERAVHVLRSGSEWEVRCESGLSERGDALLLTAPVPQSLALVGGIVPTYRREDLRRISYDPCVALMALLDGAADLPEPGGFQIKGEPLDWISDNHRKGISESPALTIHAGPRWSREHFGDPDEEVSAALLEHAEEALGRNVASHVIGTSVARWRYSWVTNNHTERFFVGVDSPPLVFAGDAFGEPKVEGASLSGLAAAEWIARRGG